MSSNKQNIKPGKQKKRPAVPVRQRQERTDASGKEVKSSRPSRYQLTDFLPTTKKEVELRGWDQLDVILFSGDAYIDHPAFGAAVIGRTLEAAGYKVAIVPQPTGMATSVISKSWVGRVSTSASHPVPWTRW